MRILSNRKPSLNGNGILVSAGMADCSILRAKNVVSATPTGDLFLSGQI